MPSANFLWTEYHFRKSKSVRAVSFAICSVPSTPHNHRPGYHLTLGKSCHTSTKLCAFTFIILIFKCLLDYVVPLPLQIDWVAARERWHPIQLAVNFPFLSPHTSLRKCPAQTSLLSSRSRDLAVHPVSWLLHWKLYVPKPPSPDDKQLPVNEAHEKKKS